MLDLEQTYWRTFLINCKLFSGVLDFVQLLKSKGIATANITDLTAQIQFRKLVYFGLDEYFDYVVTSEEAGKDKNMLLYLGALFPVKNDNYAKKISFNGKEFVADLQNKEKTNKSLKTWYKNKFKEVAVPRLFYFAEKHNLQVNQVRIKEQRTLWGSCSSRNNINLNFLLIMAPLKVIDYVIIHELVHTTHKNHSANFWSAVEEIMPNYKEAKHWLKENGYRLRAL